MKLNSKPKGQRPRAVKSRGNQQRANARANVQNQNSSISGRKANREFGGQSSISAPVAVGRAQRLRPPKIVRTNRGMRISHRELIQTVNGTVSFTAIKLACNPGIAATFPWLAPQAIQWEQYRFNKLHFEYITRTATTTVGSVLLAPDYDPSDPAPANEAQVSTYQDVVEDVTWKDICCILNASSMHALGPRKFIRNGPVAGTDIKTYDVANFYLCTVEEINTTAIGKLWVDYDVEFFVPQSAQASSTPNNSNFTSFYSQHALVTYTTATPKAIPWDTLINDPLAIGAGSSGTFTPPAGAYKIFAQASFNDSVNEPFQVIMEIQKNGASLPFPIKSQGIFEAATSTPDGSLSIEGVILCSGSDTFRIEMTLTGAAGTLTEIVDSSQLVVNPA
jgi:hypothetical protein